MSVINQMLRDLDARDANDQERAGLPPRLRTLPPAGGKTPQPWRQLALGIAIGAVAAGIVASLLMGGEPGGTSASAPPAMPPVASPATSTAPVIPAPPAAAVSPAPTFSPPAVIVDDAAMKLSTVIRRADPPAPPETTVTAAPAKLAVTAVKERPAGAKHAERPAASKKDALPAPAAEATSEAPADAPGEVQIDKRPKGGQAREQAEAEYRKGMQATKQGDPMAAAVAFQRALVRDPGFAKARQALLATLVGGRQWAEARRVAEAGLALDPAQSGWAVILARLQFEQGDADAAIGTLERHAAHANGDADYQGLFAYLLQRQQRPAEAAERFRAGLALRPGEGRWWFGLGLALENSGKPAEAKEAYARAREAGNLPADMATVIEQKIR